TGDRTDEDRADGRDVTRRGRDYQEARDDARGGSERGLLAVADALYEQPAADRRCGRGGRFDPSEPRGTVRAVGRATVEAEPAEPQQRRPEHDEREVVRTDRLGAEALALADDEREHERGDARVDVDDRAAREVDRARDRGERTLVAQQAAAPHHVSER